MLPKRKIDKAERWQRLFSEAPNRWRRSEAGWVGSCGLDERYSLLASIRRQRRFEELTRE